MSERRPQSNRPAPMSSLRQGRYRPVRSPLVSMGPSLVEERRRRRAVHRGLLVVGAMAAIGVGLTLVIVALGREVIVGGSAAQPGRATAVPSVSMSRPNPLRLAQVPAEGTGQPLALQLPINLRGVTGIGYGRRHDSDVLDLEAEGSPANMPGGERMLRRFLATRPVSAIRWFSLTESSSPNVAYIGAQPGSQVYAPVSGTVVAIADYVLNDQPLGKVVQLQPAGDAETVLVMRNLDVADGLAVGQAVSAGATLVGTVRDMGTAIIQPLATYTHDSGSCVELYVRRVTPTDPVA